VGLSVTGAGHASGRVPAPGGSDTGSRRLSLSEIDAGQRGTAPAPAPAQYKEQTYCVSAADNSPPVVRRKRKSLAASVRPSARPTYAAGSPVAAVAPPRSTRDVITHRHPTTSCRLQPPARPEVNPGHAGPRDGSAPEQLRGGATRRKADRYREPAEQEIPSCLASISGGRKEGSSDSERESLTVRRHQAGAATADEIVNARRARQQTICAGLLLPHAVLVPTARHDVLAR